MRRLKFLVATVLLVPVLALGWLTVELLDKIARVERQRIQERVEQSADVAVDVSRLHLATLEDELLGILAGKAVTPTPGTKLVTIDDRGSVTVRPGALPFLPAATRTAPTHSDALAEGERYEYRSNDQVAAAAWYLARSTVPDAAIRAGALAGLAPNPGSPRQG